MRHEVFWQRGKAIGARDKLAGSRSANVVIIGGGVAGLTVADELVGRGVEDIVVLEARFCGAGASGRSSGFITPA
ncbi:MAG: FAD-binding oxidoreductase, partial [Actinobacteria bacterium]|nr:FAD-binding oxidoreductase [Actinomycetota bacterium]